MALKLASLLGARPPFVIRSSMMNVGLKAASFVSVPPHFAIGAGWVVIRCAGVAAIVPFSSHVREQGLKRVANTNFAAGAAWTAMARIQGARGCSPPVRLRHGTTMAFPVAHFPTSASDVLWVQAFFGVHL